jgi:crotonobetainyl-CoA:carnitine CoA-transferase CaiB-like acyl-CoA transferase
VLALEGFRLLDMAPLGPGPHCTHILADLGMDVIHIDEPGEGSGRRAGRVLRFAKDVPIRRNSRSASFNLKSEEGRRAFYDLVRTADVMIEGYRPGVVKRLGVDYDTLRAIKPDIIYASLTGYGQEGPYSGYVGHDINYQGVAGILGMTGHANGPPVIAGSTTADSCGGGMNAAISILTALLARERSGAGQRIDMAMVDGLLAMMVLPIDEYVTTGATPRRGETLLTGRYPWYNVYQAQDGKFLSVGAIEPWFYENLCRELGLEQYTPDQYAEGARRDEIFAAFRAAFLTKPRDAWVAQLMPAETCVAPVYTIDEVVADRHLRHRRQIVDVEGGHEQAGVMVNLSKTPGSIRTASPERGQHTQEILSALGYDEQAIARLREAKAIG